MYELYADSVGVWLGQSYPTQDQIDTTALKAARHGWQGIQLDLLKFNEEARLIWKTQVDVSPAGWAEIYRQLHPL